MNLAANNQKSKFLNDISSILNHNAHLHHNEKGNKNHSFSHHSPKKSVAYRSE